MFLSLLPSWLYKIVRINPITNYLMMYRDVMLNGTVFKLSHLLIALAESAVMLLIGLALFAKKQDQFILHI